MELGLCSEQKPWVNYAITRTRTPACKWWWLFPCLQGFHTECTTIHSLPALFFFFLEVEISSWTLIPLFRPGLVHSGSVSWDNCGQTFPEKLRVSSSPDRFPHYAQHAMNRANHQCAINRTIITPACSKLDKIPAWNKQNLDGSIQKLGHDSRMQRPNPGVQ